MSFTLRQLRQQAGLTQTELARKAGIRQATLSSIESGESTPRKKTLQSLAEALRTDQETIRTALQPASKETPSPSIEALSEIDWPFLSNLDQDLRQGLAAELVATWTHSSTALEGNTISAGDTLFVLSEGLTVSGKSLREHQEIHGHAEALSLLADLISRRHPIRIQHLHQLHRAVQTGAVIDTRQPIGSWKTEPNGTTAVTTSGTRAWHDYARPSDVPDLIQAWLTDLATHLRHPEIREPAQIRSEKTTHRSTQEAICVEAFTDLHLGFVAIHPYADGNGRLARLLANIPVLRALRAGLPPLLIPAEQRHTYLTLLGDWTLARGQVEPGSPLVPKSPEKGALQTFFAEQWTPSFQLIQQFQAQQTARHKA